MAPSCVEIEERDLSTQVPAWPLSFGSSELPLLKHKSKCSSHAGHFSSFRHEMLPHAVCICLGLEKFSYLNRPWISRGAKPLPSYVCMGHSNLPGVFCSFRLMVFLCKITYTSFRRKMFVSYFEEFFSLWLYEICTFSYKQGEKYASYECFMWKWMQLSVKCLVRTWKLHGIVEL